MGPALRVAAENALLGVARRLLGVTKLRSLRLDQRVLSRNRTHDISVNRPKARWPASTDQGRTRNIRQRLTAKSLPDWKLSECVL